MFVCVSVCVYFYSVGIFFRGFNCMNKSPPMRTQQWMRCGTHCHSGCPAVILARITTGWCWTVLHCAMCCAGMHRHYAGGRLCWIVHFVLARTATVLVGTQCHCVVWHTLPMLARSAIVLCLARIANESCDSCRAGATTSPLIIILCSQHTAFYYFVLCLACIANESCDSCRAGATTSPLIIILCSQNTAFLLFTPFLLVRNVIVRDSRYSCCLGYRLLFPYMILFKLYIYI